MEPAFDRLSAQDGSFLDIERPGNPNMGMGATGEDLGRVTGNDARREAKIPF